jgi:RNAse (barnase) inhibitor barstar
VFSGGAAVAGSNDALQQQLQMGGLIPDSYGDPGELAHAAQALGLTVFHVECDRAKSKSAVLRAIAGAVDFPEYFGGNLDALLDCLTTTVLDQQAGALVVLCNLHENEPTLSEHVGDIMDTFADAAEYARDNARVLAVARLTREAS